MAGFAIGSSHPFSPLRKFCDQLQDVDLRRQSTTIKNYLECYFIITTILQKSSGTLRNFYVILRGILLYTTLVEIVSVLFKEFFWLIILKRVNYQTRMAI